MEYQICKKKERLCYVFSLIHRSLLFIKLKFGLKVLNISRFRQI